jgi:hypothetical protein
MESANLITGIFFEVEPIMSYRRYSAGLDIKHPGARETGIKTVKLGAQDKIVRL